MIGEKTRILGSLILFVMIIELSALGVSHSVVHVAGNMSPGVQPNVGSELNLNITLTGGGATFPAPLIQKWASAYHALNPNVTVQYNLAGATGSGAGQAYTINKTRDFGASDAPLSTRQLHLYPGILHIPETIGAVTASYNLPGISRGVLQLNGTVLANIYLNNITMWNDPQIQALNPGLTLPAQQIITVHRLDGSGTSFVFSSFLSLDNKNFRTSVGASTLPAWPPGGLYAQGNKALAGVVNSTQYTIGYVELQYAQSGNLTYAKMENPNQNFVLPTEQSTLFAVQNSTGALPSSAGDWSKVSLLNAGGTATYPIASFTYVLVYKEQNVAPNMDIKDKVQFNALIAFLNWAISPTGGQSYSAALTYVPLPPGVFAIDQAGINSMRYTEVSTPATRNISLHIGTAGWNDTATPPPIVVSTGDHVTISFSSTNAPTSHRWYIDFNNNGVQDLNETNLSFTFSTLVPAAYSFTPTVLNQSSVPAVGTYTYRDTVSGAAGSITILPQQIAAVFTAPATDLNKRPVELFPLIDNSRVATVGSLIVDLRTNKASGNVTVVDADIKTATVTYNKTYTFAAPGLQIGSIAGQPGVLLRFCLNINVASPGFALSSDVLVQLSGTTATVSTVLTRQLDFVGDGVVDAVDLSAVASAYGTALGQTGYNPQADFLGRGTVNVFSLGPFLANYQQNVYR